MIDRLTERFHQIGDPVWIWDINRRVYRKDESGRSMGGGPIWREHFREQRIESETSRSWVTNYGLKIPKNGKPSWEVCWTQEEINRRSYVHEASVPVSDLVRRVRDYDLMKQIAALVGYEEK